MEKRIALITVVATVVLGLGILGFFIFNTPSESNKVKMPLSEQEVVVTKVECDIKDLEVEVSIKEGETPRFVVTYTNNAQEDIDLLGNEVCYYDSFGWGKKSKITVSESGNPLADPLIGYSVFCNETVERIEETMGETITNVLDMGYNPWQEYHNMDELGNYKMLIELQGEETEQTGYLTIEWTQTEKE